MLQGGIATTPPIPAVPPGGTAWTRASARPYPAIRRGRRRWPPAICAHLDTRAAHRSWSVKMSGRVVTILVNALPHRLALWRLSQSASDELPHDLGQRGLKLQLNLARQGVREAIQEPVGQLMVDRIPWMALVAGSLRISLLRCISVRASACGNFCKASQPKGANPLICKLRGSHAASSLLTAVLLALAVLLLPGAGVVLLLALGAPLGACLDILQPRFHGRNPRLVLVQSALDLLDVLLGREPSIGELLLEDSFHELLHGCLIHPLVGALAAFRDLGASLCRSSPRFLDRWLPRCGCCRGNLRRRRARGRTKDGLNPKRRHKCLVLVWKNNCADFAPQIASAAPALRGYRLRSCRAPAFNDGPGGW